MKENETIARSQVMIDSYITTVVTELAAMDQVYNKHIIPRCLEHAKLTNTHYTSEKLNKFNGEFNHAFDHLLEAHDKLVAYRKLGNGISIAQAQEIRDYLFHAGVYVDKVSRFLPRDPNWPEWDEFLLI